MSLLSFIARPFSYVLFPGNFSLVVFCASDPRSAISYIALAEPLSTACLVYSCLFGRLCSPSLFALVGVWMHVDAHLIGTLYNAIAGSIASAASGAMQVDCLPCDDRGHPYAAAQDMNIYMWAMLLPVTGFPLLLGKSVSWFPSHDVAYSRFWLVGGCVDVLSYLLH